MNKNKRTPAEMWESSFYAIECKILTNSSNCPSKALDNFLEVKRYPSNPLGNFLKANVIHQIHWVIF